MVEQAAVPPVTQNPVVWRNPLYARAFGQIAGFLGATPKGTIDSFYERLNIAPDAKIVGLPTEDVILIGHMIDGYASARGIAK